MGESDQSVEETREYATETNPKLFDRILPAEPSRLSTDVKRINYKTPAGTPKVFSLERRQKYHDIIFKAFSSGFHSAWSEGLSDNSRSCYFERVHKFVDWINDSGYRTTSRNRYDVLKNYEAFQMNERGIKNSPLVWINAVLREGMICSSLAQESYDYLLKLISLSKPAKHEDPNSVSLSSWFDLPWLRSVIGEKSYLKLESPRLVFNSFRVTIATTLLWLLEQRRSCQRLRNIQFTRSSKGWQTHWSSMFLEQHGKFNAQGEPEDSLTEFLFLDLVKPGCQTTLKEKIANSGINNLPKSMIVDGMKKNPWQTPIILRPEYQDKYSPLEELLCAWLAACEAIQPTDIPKLKASNYARETNRLGRLIAMECTYYKGRAGDIRQPATLMGSAPWTRALDLYISGLSSSRLFSENVGKSVMMTSLDHRHTLMHALFKIWKLKSFQQILRSELKKVEASSLFVFAILALEQGGDFQPSCPNSCP